MLSQAEWKTHSSTGGVLWKQESSVISWLWPSGFIFQPSLASKLVCIWSQKPQTALQLFSFQGREGQGVSSTFGCLWSLFDHRRDNEDKSCTPTRQIILTNKLRSLLPGNSSPERMQDAEDLFIEIHPHPEQYYINFKMSSFPNYNKNSAA